MEKKVEQQRIATPDAPEQADSYLSLSAFAASKACLVGTTLGRRYKLESVLGVGGWSAVYRGLDLNLRRPVAVKVLHAHLIVDPESLQRFQQEAMAASQITHSHLAAVYDFGLADEQPFIVMELVEGRTLDHIVHRGGKLDFKRAVPFIVQICDALEAVHARGIIHRDVKPANIMIVQDRTGKESAKLVDFGLVKCQGDLVLHHTGTGETLGTPAFMSPEQCMGTVLDARSDIYSLGCCLYESLTARKPFIEQSVLGYMHKHVSEAPPPINNAEQECVPKAVTEIVYKALEKQREDRFSTAGEMSDALQSALRDLSPETIATGSRAKELSARAKIVWSATAIAVLGSVAVLVYFAAANFKSQSAPSLAGHPSASTTGKPRDTLLAAKKGDAPASKTGASDVWADQPVLTLNGFYPTQGPYLLDRLRIAVKLNEAKRGGTDMSKLETVWMRMDANANRNQKEAVRWDVDYLNRSLGLIAITSEERQNTKVIETRR